MPRALAIEESALTQQHEARQRSKRFETGLLVAQAGAKLDTILRLVPTPDEGGGDAAAGAVDADWVLEHATQVARMLPGGVVVLGCYAFAAGAKLPHAEAKLVPVLAALAKRLPSELAERHAALLLLPSDSKKATCRALPLGSARAQPLELKFTHAPPQLSCLVADWAVDVRLSLGPAASPSAQLAALTQQLAAHGDALARATATIDGALPPPGTLLSQLAGAGTLEQPHRVALYAASPAPPLAPPAAAPEGDSAAEAGGVAVTTPAAAWIHLKGILHGRTFASPKDSVGAALGALSRDLVGSLRARLALYFDELAEEEEEEEEEGESGGGLLDVGRAAVLALPRRAHVSVGGGLSLCDYLGADDAPSDCAERFTALLGVDALASGDDDAALEALLGPEAAADPLSLTVPPPPPGSAAAAPRRRQGGAAGGGAGAGGAAAAGGGGGGGSAAAAPKATAAAGGGGLPYGLIVGCLIALVLALVLAAQFSATAGASAPLPSPSPSDVAGAAAAAAESVPTEGAAPSDA